MITLSNGHKFEYMAASGAMAFDGRGWFWEKPLKYLGLFNPRLFTVVLKTLTLLPRKGNLKWYNPLRCIRLLGNGVVNAVGLTNPGIDWWSKNIGPKINLSKFPIVASIFGEPEDIIEMSKILNLYDLAGIEINCSCPNTEKEIMQNIGSTIVSIEMAKKYSRFPIILKISVVQDVNAIARNVGEMIEAFSINSVPWQIMYPDKISPLERFGGGGVSGEIVQTHTWTMMKRIKRISSIPVIAPSIWNYEDIETVRAMGANAISFGSVFVEHPWRPTLFVKMDMKARKKIETKTIT